MNNCENCAWAWKRTEVNINLKGWKYAGYECQHVSNDGNFVKGTDSCKYFKEKGEKIYG